MLICNRNSQETQIKERVRSQHTYLQQAELNSLYDFSLSDYLMIKYPSKNNRPSRDKLQLDFSDSNWIYKRMIDILGRAGGISAEAYKENNLNIAYGASYIDPELYSLLTPSAGVPR